MDDRVLTDAEWREAVDGAMRAIRRSVDRAARGASVLPRG